MVGRGRIGRILPNNGDDIGRKFLDNIGIKRAHVGPSQERFSVFFEFFTHEGQLLDVQRLGIEAFLLRTFEAFGFPRFIKTNVDKRTFEQRSVLFNPVFEQFFHACVARIHLVSVATNRQRRILFIPNEFVQMPIKIDEWNHVHVPLSLIHI